MSISDKSLSLFNRDVIIFLSKIVTGAIIARKLGPDNMGIWIMLMLIPQYAEAFGRLKFDVAAVYFLGKKKYKLGEILFHLNVIALLVSIIIIGIFFLNMNNIISNFLIPNNIDSSLLLLMLLYIPQLFITINYQYILISLEDIKSYNLLSIIREFVGSGFAIILLLFTNYGIQSLAIAWNVSAFLAILFAYVKVRQIEKVIFKVNVKLIKEMAIYSYKLYISGMISFLNHYISSLIVALFMNPSQLAFFRLGQGKVQILNRIPSAIGTILYPVISKTDDNNNHSIEIITKAFRVCLLILFFSGIMFSIAIYPLTILLYGREFLPLTISFWILLPAIIFNGSYSVINHYFLGIGRPDLDMKISVLPLISQILLLYIFIPIYGISGAAIALSISFVIYGIITLAVFKKITDIKLLKFLIPTKKDYDIIYNFIIRKIKTLKTKIIL